jgi:transglutaminase-like putative cysteine protease
MQASYESEYEMSSTERYLQAGEQTQVTPKVERLVSGIEGSVVGKSKQILDIVHSLEKRKYDSGVFRKRTGSQIIEDNYRTGCTDDVLAFITLARASGIPTKYVETIDKDWLKEGGSPIMGHVYAQVYDDRKDKWIWVDPRGKSIGRAPKKRVVFEEGLDSWDIGIKDSEELGRKFNTFRQEWLSKSKA